MSFGHIDFFIQCHGMSQGRDSALRNKLNYGFAEVVLYAEFAKIVPVKNRNEKKQKSKQRSSTKITTNTLY